MSKPERNTYCNDTANADFCMCGNRIIETILSKENDSYRVEYVFDKYTEIKDTRLITDLKELWLPGAQYCPRVKPKEGGCCCNNKIVETIVTKENDKFRVIQIFKSCTGFFDYCTDSLDDLYRTGVFFCPYIEFDL